FRQALGLDGGVGRHLFQLWQTVEVRTRIAVVLCSLALAAPAENSLTRAEKREGFIRLFDGKSLALWHSVKQRPDAGSWRIVKKALTWDRGGSWLATDETYYDFLLKLEYRTGEKSNSGIFLRARPEGDPAFSGMELQIASDDGRPPGPRSTGALYGAAAPSKNMARPTGEWNQVEVSLIGRRLSVVWNGEKIHDLDLDDPQYAKAQERPLADRAPFGHVGLQAYSSGAPVEFRNLRIKAIKIGPPFVFDNKR
ncbi:MAG: 3-keto-disaccharide hydrolase, partial [Bryobacteraceae bacterium]